MLCRFESQSRFFALRRRPANLRHFSFALILCTSMPHLTPEAKHHILLEYRPRDAAASFVALARRHGIKGGSEVVRRWHQRWNRTVRSLQERHRSGRPRILTSREVQQHVRAPILAANRAATAIHYTELLPTVRRRTGKKISIRTLRRYGRKDLGARNKSTKKRTEDECKCGNK
jgi:transposase